MVKIIKHGEPAKLKPDITFACKKCGCVFVASWGEYTRHYGRTHDGTWYEARCPECNSVAGEEINNGI